MRDRHFYNPGISADIAMIGQARVREVLHLFYESHIVLGGLISGSNKR